MPIGNVKVLPVVTTCGGMLVAPTKFAARVLVACSHRLTCVTVPQGAEAAAKLISAALETTEGSAAVPTVHVVPVVAKAA